MYLKQETDADGSTHRLAGTEKITKDNETALNGQHVWAYLVEAQKAYAAGDFDKVALRHQLQLHPGTWGQPLQKIRDDFYKTPRSPHCQTATPIYSGLSSTLSKPATLVFSPVMVGRLTQQRRRK